MVQNRQFGADQVGSDFFASADLREVTSDASCSGSPQMPRKNHTWSKSGSTAFGSVERKHLAHAEGTRYAEPTGLRPFLTGSKPRTRLNPGLWELSAGSESYTIWGHSGSTAWGKVLTWGHGQSSCLCVHVCTFLYTEVYE